MSKVIVMIVACFVCPYCIHRHALERGWNAQRSMLAIFGSWALPVIAYVAFA